MKKRKEKQPPCHILSYHLKLFLLQHAGGGNLNKIKRKIDIVIKKNNTW